MNPLRSMRSATEAAVEVHAEAQLKNQCVGIPPADQSPQDQPVRLKASEAMRMKARHMRFQAQDLLAKATELEELTDELNRWPLSATAEKALYELACRY